MSLAAVQGRSFAVTVRGVRWRAGLVLLLVAGGLCGCGTSAAAGHGSRMRAGSVCDVAVAAAPVLGAVSRAAVPVPGNPFAVVATADGRWSFVTLNGAVEVLSNRSLAPAAGRQVSVPGTPLGEQLTHDGRYLLVADGSGAVVIDVARAEGGAAGAVVGMLSSPAGRGAAEVALSPDDRFAFVTLEISNSLAVFDLHKALTSGFGSSDFVGTVPLGIAPVGLAVSPDGHWIYATSQAGRGDGRASLRMGTVTVIDLRQAEIRPADAVAAAVPAGCSPVRVITSADGKVLWVTARGSDAVLGFSATALRTDPSHALVARVQVGQAPVGLVLADHGQRLVVADSNRFRARGAVSNLAIVNVSAALAGRPALLGLIPTGTFPREMTVIPHTHTLLVTDYLSEQVQAVNLASVP
jgi:DNA-binding beta-propeller fold protein YncE